MKPEIDPWGKGDVKDYGKIMADFGLEPFGRYAKLLPDPPVFMRRGAVFAQRDFGRVFECIKNKKPFAMLTGLMPSGKFHLGHMMVAQQIVYYQQLGAQTFITIADTEAYNVRKMGMEKLRKIAIEEYLLNYIALGLKPKNCTIYFQSDYITPYYNLIGKLPRYTTENEFKAIYGSLEPAKMISVFTQIADILQPQLEESGGPKPVIVPVGIDQDPHIRYTRDIASRIKDYNFVLPSSTYHRFMRGLQGGKMSSSDPFSYIALTDTPEEAEMKIRKHAFSGGRETVEEHRKLGANIEVDVSYEYLFNLFEPDDRKMQRIKEDYGSGKMLTGELKHILIEKITKFLEEHHKRREKGRKLTGKFLD